MVAIENVDPALLAAGDEFMGKGAVKLIGEDEGSGGTQVKIVGVEVSHVPRGEIIGDREIGAKLHDAIAVGLATVWDIEAVGAGFGGLNEYVGFVGGETVAGLPDGSQSAVGRGVEDSELRQTGSAVGQDPAAVAVVAEVRAEAQVKDTVEQQKAGTVFLVEAVEDGDVSLIAGAGGGDQDGAAKLLRSGSDVEGVKVVTDLGPALDSLSHHIDRVGG